MRRYGAVLALLLGCGVTVAVATRLIAEELASSDPLAEELTALLTEQAKCWNAADIGAFMQYYWNSDELTFSSGGTTRRGWDATLRRYRQRYPTAERMGQLTFSDLEVRRLGETAALVLGRWHLSRDPDAIGGNFSLVFEKIDDRWVIVHDHTSQAA
jgi:beta-aspartyl-peptidase (threonine type)